jgi:cytoskeleton protein RodZ
MTNITLFDFDPNRRDPERRLHLRAVSDDRAPRYQGIGSEFAAARMQAGMEVAQVAAALRIRKEHLAAIEEGRFNDLPAPAYALGFVRSYADYLGLDPAAAVEAFKQETSTSRRRTPLVFPTVEPVKRVTRGWLLGMSALLAAVVFGAWYYFEKTSLVLLERVPAVPGEPGVQAAATPAPAPNAALGVVDVRTANAVTAPAAAPTPAAATPGANAALDPAIGRVLGVLPGTQAAPAPPPPAAQAVATSATPPPTTRPAVTPAPPPPTPVVAAVPPVAAPTPAPIPAPAPVVAAVAPAAPAILTPPTAAPAPEVAAIDPAMSPLVPPAGEPVAVVEELPALAPAPAAVAEPIVTPPAILAPPVAVAAAELPAVAPIVPPAAPLDVAVAAREGQVFGASTGRVVILAHQDSWVQVTGAAGALLLTRILRAGDKYIAPAREDLVLMTGNAGALEVSVDGKIIPPLGPPGTVRRNVSLSAERLLNGTAIQP